MHNDLTKRGYQLPHKDNVLAVDVERIRNAFISIDNDLSKIQTGLGLYLDEDGDICQDLDFVLNQDQENNSGGDGEYIKDPADENQNQGNNQNNSGEIATDEEIDSMLDDIFGGE